MTPWPRGPKRREAPRYKTVLTVGHVKDRVAWRVARVRPARYSAASVSFHRMGAAGAGAAP
jgi:hypothetical protein